VLASSRIRTYEVVLSVLYFLNVACAYLALKLGAAPEAVFVLAILFKFFVLLLLIHQSNKLFSFDMRSYLKMFATRIMPILAYGCVISAVYLMFVKNDTFLKLIGFTLAFEALTLPVIWTAGLSASERAFVKNIIYERLHIKKKS